MALEIDWQAKIVKRLRSEGAYARKASSTYAVGVLDLDIVSPVFGAVKIEIKMERALKPGWKRKIEYTERQKDEAFSVNQAGGCAFGLVLCHYSPQNVWMVPQVMPLPREIVSMTEGDLNLEGKKWTKSAEGLYLTNFILAFMALANKPSWLRQLPETIPSE